MKTKTIEIIAISIIMVMFFYSIVALATIGRFTTTHVVVLKSDCTGCHIDSLSNLDTGKHIGSMNKNQSYVVDNFFLLKQSADVQGLCYSCHITPARTKYFGFRDFFIDTNNNSAINDIILLNGSTETTGATETENIEVNITLESVSPVNTSVMFDATVQLVNFSGHQNFSKLSTNTLKSLIEGESTIIHRDNIYGDYFRVFVTVYGDWDTAKINLSIVSPTKYPAVTLHASKNGTTTFVLPTELPLQYSYLLYFHTEGNYSVTKVTDAVSSLNSIGNESIFQSYELMNDTIGGKNTSRYTCGSIDTMCHINQRITDIGQRFGINGGRFYNHEMEYPNSRTCYSCHIYN